MGLDLLLNLPWGAQCSSLIADLKSREPSEATRATIRAQPKKWTMAMIGQAFNLPLDGEMLMTTKCDIGGAFFSGQRDTRIGWRVDQCNNPTLKCLLAFINPVLYPHRQERVLLQHSNTVIAAWSQQRKTNWATIFRDVLN
ncbi:unnamed protein product [Calypogeia fissa]